MNMSAKQKKMHQKVIEPWHANDGFVRLRRESTQLVPGTGNLNALIMIVGEAPGEEEDREGKPFVGPAGQLLTEMLVAAHIDRTQCWITNLVKFRPVSKDGYNRQPTFNERKLAQRYLAREMQIIGARVVVLCGRIAYNAIKPGSITQARGHAFTMAGTKGRRIYLPIFHPAACLRDPETEAATRRDLAVSVPALLGNFDLAMANALAVPRPLTEVVQH